MRLKVSFFAAIAAAAIFIPCVSLAQTQQPAPQAPPPPAAQTPAGPSSSVPYSPGNPLSGVRYDNRFDLTVGLAYDHMKAGPTLLQGSNLGGLDVSGSYWFAKHWGAEGSGRAYVGTSGTAPNPYNIQGPFVAQYFFVGGPEWLGPHNEHGDLTAHALFGGVYGKFEQDLRGQSPSVVDFYNDQLAPAAIIGGHIDLNRSPRWVFRITPDAVITHYSINYAPSTTQWDVNFAISVGVEYKFKRLR